MHSVFFRPAFRTENAWPRESQPLVSICPDATAVQGADDLHCEVPAITFLAYIYWEKLLLKEEVIGTWSMSRRVRHRASLHFDPSRMNPATCRLNCITSLNPLTNKILNKKLIPAQRPIAFICFVLGLAACVRQSTCRSSSKRSCKFARSSRAVTQTPNP